MGIIVFSSTISIPLALIALVQVGIGQVLIFSSSNSLLQTLSRSSHDGKSDKPVHYDIHGCYYTWIISDRNAGGRDWCGSYTYYFGNGLSWQLVYFYSFQSIQ